MSGRKRCTRKRKAGGRKRCTPKRKAGGSSYIMNTNDWASA